MIRSRALRLALVAYKQKDLPTYLAEMQQAAATASVQWEQERRR